MTTAALSKPEAAAADAALRLVVFAPVGRDGPLICELVGKRGFDCALCRDARELSLLMQGEVGALILTAEALGAETRRVLREALERQGAWSDLPIVLLVRSADEHALRLAELGEEANLTVLERPLRVATLLSVVRAALRARRRQYQVRELLEQREALNRNLEARSKTLEALNGELRAFSYSVSHDLRAPLRRIDSFSQLLLEDAESVLSDDARHYLERIRVGARRMNELIEALLKLSRLSRHELDRREVDLSALAREVAERLAEQQPDRPVAFEAGEAPTVWGDPNLLRVVLENLLGNAWKFTRRQREPRVYFGASSEGGEVVYLVRDNGAGFDMQFASKLFGAFQRLHSSSEFEGTGIGLATVQRIVHRHGGRVWAEAEPGEGATFYFTLA